MALNTELIMTWIVGLAWVFLIIEWLDLVWQFFALNQGALPEGLDVSSREKAAEHASAVEGRSIIARRVRSLLTAFSHGATSQDIAGLSWSQSFATSRRLAAVGIFMALVFVAGLKLSQATNPAWLGLALVGATIFAKTVLHGRIDNLIETRLLIRIPANLPGAAVTGAELGQSLGGAIEQAFKAYVPQPDKVASVIGEAVERGRKAAAEAEKSSVAAIEAARKAVEASASQLASGLSTHTDKVQSVLAQHADQIAKASQGISAQLDRIMSLEKEIEKVLHVQQTVDGAIRSVASADEFKQLVAALRGHLQESDKLLKEVARPRTIRLVESDQ